MIKRINHVAIAVDDIDEALKFWSDALGLELSHTEAEPGQRVVVAFLPAGESEIELVEPVGEDSPVSRFLKKRGAGLHHICLEVADIQATLARLKARGVELIDQEPYIGTGGKRIAFIHPRAAHGVLVELYERRPEEQPPPLVDLWMLRERLRVEGEAVRAGVEGFLRAFQRRRDGGGATG